MFAIGEQAINVNLHEAKKVALFAGKRMLSIEIYDNIIYISQ